MKKDNVIQLDSVYLNVTLLKLIEENKNLKVFSEKAFENLSKSLLKALQLKDDYTYGHSARVAFYSRRLGVELELSDQELFELELSGLFHDIGKIGVPDSILKKPTRLDHEEFLMMKEHPTMTYEILLEVEGLEKIALSAKHHHERFDGRGYPEGLKGDNIPLFSRVILIADTFDAMTSTRPYRKGLPYEVAFRELRDFAGEQFDPHLVEKFIEAMIKDQNEKTDNFSIEVLGKKFNKEAA
ncbi:MAG: HD-GYP domain-containing protein [Halobacteriovoraceae bacterium]|nr:HD-GYP domain-containing protein [Halobacteriovoraceae bacterium]